MYVTGKALSQILGLSERHLRRLVVGKVIEKEQKSGKYFLPECVQKFVDYKLNTELGDKDVDYFKERARHEKAKREKAEIQLAQMRGQMHTAQDVEAVMMDMIITAKTKLRGISAKIAPSLIAQNEISVVEGIVSDVIDECLMELSDYKPQLFDTGKAIVVGLGGENDNEADDDRKDD